MPQCEIGSDHVEGGHDGQDDEPEPEHDVDLLVDDVEGQHAHGVVPLDRAGGTVLVEGALGDSGTKVVLLESMLRILKILAEKNEEKMGDFAQITAIFVFKENLQYFYFRK
jgi:hypothetical protein